MMECKRDMGTDGPPLCNALAGNTLPRPIRKHSTGAPGKRGRITRPRLPADLRESDTACQPVYNMTDTQSGSGNSRQDSGCIRGRAFQHLPLWQTRRRMEWETRALSDSARREKPRSLMVILWDGILKDNQLDRQNTGLSPPLRLRDHQKKNVEADSLAVAERLAARDQDRQAQSQTG